MRHAQPADRRSASVTAPRLGGNPVMTAFARSARFGTTLQTLGVAVTAPASALVAIADL